MELTDDQRAVLSRLAHGDHPLAAPLGAAAADALLGRGGEVAGRPARVLDVGCGLGWWVVRALERWPDATGDGVDVSSPALEAARERAMAAGVASRLALRLLDAAELRVDDPYDVVLCVGAAEALGTFDVTLAMLRRWVRPGGTAVVGRAFWANPPTPGALAALRAGEDEFDDLAGTVARVEEAGWVPVDGHVSDAAEWDDYEWSWSGSLARFALDHPDDPLAAAARELAAEHRRAWLTGYRGVLGFVTLVLATG